MIYCLGTILLLAISILSILSFDDNQPTLTKISAFYILWSVYWFICEFETASDLVAKLVLTNHMRVQQSQLFFPHPLYAIRLIGRWVEKQGRPDLLHTTCKHPIPSHSDLHIQHTIRRRKGFHAPTGFGIRSYKQIWIEGKMAVECLYLLCLPCG